MNAPAPGQMLGYGIQFPRALLYLLKSGAGSVVSIEYVGDVAAKLPTGVVSEEDKSSLTGNPVTDRSIDLWKTFANWVDAVTSGVLKPANTRFVLYRNKGGRTGIVNSFDLATTEENANQAIDAAASALSDLTSEHAAWTYYNKAVNENRKILAAIVERFSLETGDGAGYSELESELKRMLVPDAYVSYVSEQLSGWLFKTITERIASGQVPEVTWEEFSVRSAACFETARRRELIDFAQMRPPGKRDVHTQISSNRTYVRQLDLIECDQDDIFDAVTSYLKAKTNRELWIELGLLDEAIANDFNEKLVQNYKAVAKDAKLTGKSLSDSEIGQLVLAQCSRFQTTVGQTNPPSSTIAGTYHLLADHPVIGWHPKWKSRL